MPGTRRDHPNETPFDQHRSRSERQQPLNTRELYRRPYFHA